MAKPRVLLVRDAAIGDALMITPAIRYWSDKGYRVDVACKRHVGNAVYSGNPHVHQCVDLDKATDMVARDRKLDKIKARRPYEIVFDVALTCEGKYLYHSSHPMFHESIDVRRMAAQGASYYRHINHDVCGVRDANTLVPEMYVLPQEERWWTTFRSRNIGIKLVQVQIGGSSINKHYPWWWQVIKELQRDPRVVVVTTGDEKSTIIEQEAVAMGCDPGRMWACCANPRYTLRDALVMTAFVDLVIGPETGVINAAAAWSTPKIVLMSHSTSDNLCRGWENCYPIESPAECSPCYRIVGAGDPCRYVAEPPEIAGAVECMAKINPFDIVEKAREVLEKCCPRKTIMALPSARMFAPSAATVA